MNTLLQQAPLHVRGFGGLGDNCYQRPLVRHLVEMRGEIWLSTPYPEIYSDLPDVHPVRWANMRLRCQGKNMDATPPEVWSTPVPHPRAERLTISYALRTQRYSIVAEMEAGARTQITDWRFDLPDFGAPLVAPPYALIRPVSVRREWRNTGRNPDPAYVSRAADLLQAAGYRVVCVGDLDDVQEPLVGEMPAADLYWTRGELTTRQLFALVNHASVVVGGVGWLVPAALAYRTPAVILGGGVGQHNAPHLLVDGRMDASRTRFLLPEPYCMCGNPKHECRKGIPDFDARFVAALGEVTA